MKTIILKGFVLAALILGISAISYGQQTKGESKPVLTKKEKIEKLPANKELKVTEKKAETPKVEQKTQKVEKKPVEPVRKQVAYPEKKAALKKEEIKKPEKK
ncbi:MAG: hypothetical protein R3277_04015 [Brumimicrobium sp.]|nr:hypothetical protein [Brumimicrobium sp.]